MDARGWIIKDILAAGGSLTELLIFIIIVLVVWEVYDTEILISYMKVEWNEQKNIVRMIEY